VADSLGDEGNEGKEQGEGQGQRHGHREGERGSCYVRSFGAEY